MAKPPLPPTRAREAKTALRLASKAAREARIAWTKLRDIYKAGNAGDSQGDIITSTLRMWTAERELEIAAGWWRTILAERADMPVADRWDLAALERWASALDKDGAP